MLTATKNAAPSTYAFADDGRIPNNPTLPLILYRGSVDLSGSPDPEKLIEKTFADNGWGNMWRNGIYPYVHYHSLIDVALGIAPRPRHGRASAASMARRSRSRRSDMSPFFRPAPGISG